MNAVDKILIVDDHQLFTAGLSTVLDQMDRPLSVHELSSATQALSELEQQNDYQLILVDLKMPTMSGLDFLRALNARSIDAKVCIISGTEDVKQIQIAFDAGAIGFIPKSSPVSIMAQGIEKVLSGGVYLPDYLKQTIVIDSKQSGAGSSANGSKASSDERSITSRQKEILVLMQEGKTNNQIADILAVSPSTVKFHVAGLFRLLNVRTRTECVNVARQRNLT